MAVKVAFLVLLPSASAFMIGTTSVPGLWRSAAVSRNPMQSRSTSISPLSMSFITHYEEISVSTGRSITLIDITKTIRDIVTKSECKEGVVTVLSKHSTVSVTITEMEGRLVDDTRQFLLNLAPPYEPYLHNDLDFRFGLQKISLTSHASDHE